MSLASYRGSVSSDMHLQMAFSRRFMSIVLCVSLKAMPV